MVKPHSPTGVSEPPIDNADTSHEVTNVAPGAMAMTETQPICDPKEEMVELVQAMVRESGRPENFDAAQWLEGWIGSRNPALGGNRPADFLATQEGKALIFALLGQMQSGAYS